MEWIFLVLIGLVLLFGIGVLVVNRRRAHGSISAPSAPPRTPPTAPPQVPPGAGTTVLEPEVVDEPPVVPEVVTAPLSLRERMSRARSALAGAFVGVRGRRGITEETWDELEEALLRADVGIGVTTDLLDGLIGIHSAGPQYGGAGYSTQSTAMTTTGVDDAVASRVEHPVVITHPETGRRGLYVNPAFTIGIKGMHRAESQALLRFLYRHATAEEMTCRFQWRPGSVAMWDNRSVQHYALHDYKGHRRRMRRITIRGERPRA